MSDKAGVEQQRQQYTPESARMTWFRLSAPSIDLIQSAGLDVIDKSADVVFKRYERTCLNSPDRLANIIFKPCHVSS